jgi:hypothetical protein
MGGIVTADAKGRYAEPATAETMQAEIAWRELVCEGLASRRSTRDRPIPSACDGATEGLIMIIQTGVAGEPRLAIMMYEHTALAGQFARAFGNEHFAPVEPEDLMVYVVSHHDEGWAAFDRHPATDPNTGLPYNLIETPAEHITRTSRLSPDFNEQRHPYCGLMSSMHSWGLYNGRYGLSSLVLINTIPPQDRHWADSMLEAELARQKRLKAELAKDPGTKAWLADDHLFQNYKQLQFFDTLALYFNRIHPAARGEQKFEHVPLNGQRDVTISIRPRGPEIYEISPYPFAANRAEFAYPGRYIAPRGRDSEDDWSTVLKQTPTQWECFQLVAV